MRENGNRKTEIGEEKASQGGDYFFDSLMKRIRNEQDLLQPKEFYKLIQSFYLINTESGGSFSDILQRFFRG